MTQCPCLGFAGSEQLQLPEQPVAQVPLHAEAGRTAARTEAAPPAAMAPISAPNITVLQVALRSILYIPHLRTDVSDHETAGASPALGDRSRNSKPRAPHPGWSDNPRSRCEIGNPLAPGRATGDLATNAKTAPPRGAEPDHSKPGQQRRLQTGKPPGTLKLFGVVPATSPWRSLRGVRHPFVDCGKLLHALQGWLLQPMKQLSPQAAESCRASMTLRGQRPRTPTGQAAGTCSM
jgi:hypothetical protein